MTLITKDIKDKDSVVDSSVKSNVTLKRSSIFDYFTAELTRSYALELEEERYVARREKVYMFMNIPKELERLMAYGFFHCADAFLFIFTFLPLRCLISLIRYAVVISRNFVRRHFRPPWKRRPPPSYSNQSILKGAEKCDILKILVFFFCVNLFSYVDTSVLYHVIKSQSVIKLYIFFNMLEVGDRLLNSFVQDTLDALFLTATEKNTSFWESGPKAQMSLSAHFLLTIFSVFIHALVILCQGTTLSVAINASNRVLLTVMMSNNFVELKGAVFKKFDKMNLFQVSCSDIRERFHLCVLLMVVCIQTMREYSWEEARFWVLFPDCLTVIIAEVGVDWVKHAFITRFNEIPSEVYREYTLSLAYDLAQTKQKRTLSDHCDIIGRRLGFIPLPLAVVLARVIQTSLKGPLVSTIILSTLGLIALATFRLLNSIVLLGKACDLIDQHNAATAAKSNGTTTTKAPSPVHSIPVPIKSEPDITSSFFSEANKVALAKVKIETDTDIFDNHIVNKENNFNFPFRDQTNHKREKKVSESSDVFSPDNFNLHKFEQVSKKLLQHRSDTTFRPWKPYHRRKKYLEYNRSYSASHTPRRKSITGVNKDGSTEDLSVSGIMESTGATADQDNSKPLLMANSAVSILSLSLNEEMLRAESASEKERNRKKSGGTAGESSASAHVRKHSLGSCLENEFTTGNEDDSERDFNNGKKILDDDEGSSSGDKTIRCNTPADPQSLTKEDLDSTLIAGTDDVDEIQGKEDETSHVCGDEGKPKPKKKKSLTAWLLSSQKE